MWRTIFDLGDKNELVPKTSTGYTSDFNRL